MGIIWFPAGALHVEFWIVNLAWGGCYRRCSVCMAVAVDLACCNILCCFWRCLLRRLVAMELADLAVGSVLLNMTVF